MNCEHVEESLSTYLDNMLAPDERRAIAIHLQTCPGCTIYLAELRQNDTLLAQLPRIRPGVALRERLFASPEMFELTGTVSTVSSASQNFTQAYTRDARAQNSRETVKGPQLVSAPGVHSSSFEQRYPLPKIAPTPTTEARSAYHRRSVRAEKRYPTPLQIALAAVIIVGLATASLIGLSLRHSASTTTNISGAITPPAGPGLSQGEPLAAGMRFIFLRDGTLWSTLADGKSHQVERLTPPDVTVAPHWSVNSPMKGHSAGNMLTYIDLRSAKIHVIRSDGQQDRMISQDLLPKASISASTWKTQRGGTILSSPAWSNDGNLLAFVGDPTGNGQTNLFIYSLETNTVQTVELNSTGAIARPIWSPDGTRLAFTMTNEGITSIFDYNTQTRESVELTNLAESRGNGTNIILTLAWSPIVSDPAVTWSLGVIGNVSSLWIHRVGANNTAYPQLLVKGSYVQALYSAHGGNGSGSWLLVLAESGQAGDIWRIDLTSDAGLIRLSIGKQVSLASWSSNGTFIFYLDTQTNGISNGHIVNSVTGTDQFFASNVSASPMPVWSPDASVLAYSAGNQIKIIDANGTGQPQQLHLHGTVTTFSWSPTGAPQLVVALSDTTPGIYLVDITHNTSLQLDRLSTSGPIDWTEIP